MSDYVTNGPISVPLIIPGVQPDVDMGGVKFSYEIGMYYTPETEVLPIRLPPPFEGGNP